MDKLTCSRNSQSSTHQDRACDSRSLIGSCMRELSTLRDKVCTSVSECASKIAFSTPALEAKKVGNGLMRAAEAQFPFLKDMRCEHLRNQARASDAAIEFKPFFGKYQTLPAFRGANVSPIDPNGTCQAPKPFSNAQWQGGLLFSRVRVEEQARSDCEKPASTSGTLSASLSRDEAVGRAPAGAFVTVVSANSHSSFVTSQYHYKESSSVKAEILEAEIASLDARQKPIFEVKIGSESEPVRFKLGTREAMLETPRTIQASQYLEEISQAETIPQEERQQAAELLEAWKLAYPEAIDGEQEYFNDMANSMEEQKVRYAQRRVRRDHEVMQEHAQKSRRLQQLPFGRQLAACYDAFFLGTHISQFRETHEAFEEIEPILHKLTKKCDEAGVECQVVISKKSGEIDVKPSDMDHFTAREKESFERNRRILQGKFKAHLENQRRRPQSILSTTNRVVEGSVACNAVHFAVDSLKPTREVSLQSLQKPEAERQKDRNRIDRQAQRASMRALRATERRR